jgi:hypothetical protein
MSAAGAPQEPEQAQLPPTRSREEEYEAIAAHAQQAAQEAGGRQLRQRASARQQAAQQQAAQQQWQEQAAQQQAVQQHAAQRAAQQQAAQQQHWQQQQAAQQQHWQQQAQRQWLQQEPPPVVGRKREHSPGWTPMGLHVQKRRRMLRTRPNRNTSALARFGKPLPPARLDDYYEGSDFSSGSDGEPSEPGARSAAPARYSGALALCICMRMRLGKRQVASCTSAV